MLKRGILPFPGLFYGFNHDSLSGFGVGKTPNRFGCKVEFLTYYPSGLFLKFMNTLFHPFSLMLPVAVGEIIWVFGF